MSIGKEQDYLFIENHTLHGPKVKHLKAKKLTRKMSIVLAAVVHFTAGGSAMSSAQHLAASHTDVSAHFVISQDGEIIQITPTNHVAWHAGISELNGMKGVNNFSIGIELANAGKLHRRVNRFYTWFNKEIMPDKVYTHCENGRATYWEIYPTKQIDRLVELLAVLVQEYKIAYIVGHSDITDRKIDPGPAYPAEDVVKRVHDCMQENTFATSA